MSYPQYNAQMNQDIQVSNIHCFSIADDEDQNHEVVSCHLEKELEPEGIRLEHEAILLRDQPVEPVSTAAVLTEALTERKTENYKQINQYMRDHMEYCIPHMDILIRVETALLTKMHNAKIISQSLSEYLTHLKAGHQIYKSHLVSVTAKQTNVSSLSNSSKFKAGLNALPAIHNNVIQQIEAFGNFVDKECLVQISESLQMFQKALECYAGQINFLKTSSNKHMRLMFGQYQCIQKLMIQGTKNGFDILFEEIHFIQHTNKTNESIKEWGKMLNFFWRAVTSNEIILMKSLKKQVCRFFTEFQKISLLSSKNEDLLGVWGKIDCEREIVEAYSLKELLGEESLEFVVKNSGLGDGEEREIDRFQGFCRMETGLGRMESLDTLISKLVLKRFICELERGEKGQVTRVEVVSTMDGNLVFILPFAENKAHTKMSVLEISIDRLDQLRIAVYERRSGLLRKTKNTETLLFKTKDEADQFHAFAAKTPEERDSILL